MCYEVLFFIILIIFSPPGTIPVMDSEDYEYWLFTQLLNATANTSDPSYVVSGDVQLCQENDVNNIGAKIIPVFYYINFLLSYIGNGLVLFIIYKYEKLNSVTNIFLLNLVLSNILFASSLPFWATYHLSEWVFGEIMCKLVSSAYSVGFCSSILFLTLMTLDRYLAVVHTVPAAKREMRAYAIVGTLTVWLVSVAASVKEFVLQTVWKSPLNGLMCEEAGYPLSTMLRWRLVSYYQQFLLFFLLPLFMVMYCYTSITVRVLSTRLTNKCRTVKLIFVTVFTFFICWTPYNVVIFLYAIQLSSPDGEDSCSQTLDSALYMTRNIAYVYCCISPVFYTFVGKKFQSHFRKLISRKIPCIEKHVSLSSQSTRTTSQRTAHSVY